MTLRFVQSVSINEAILDRVVASEFVASVYTGRHEAETGHSDLYNFQTSQILYEQDDITNQIVLSMLGNSTCHASTHAMKSSHGVLSPRDWPLVLDRVANYRSAPNGDGFTSVIASEACIRSPNGLWVFNPESSRWIIVVPAQVSHCRPCVVWESRYE